MSCFVSFLQMLMSHESQVHTRLKKSNEATILRAGFISSKLDDIDMLSGGRSGIALYILILYIYIIIYKYTVHLSIHTAGCSDVV